MQLSVRVAGFIVFARPFMEGHVGSMVPFLGERLSTSRSFLSSLLGLFLSFLFISAPPVPAPSLSSYPPLLFFTFDTMTRLLSDICYFGLADGIPNPEAAISKAIATSSIISCHPSPGPGFTSLPDDVLLLVISLIGVEDILALRMVCTHDLDSSQIGNRSQSSSQTSKRFISVTKQRWVWSDALKYHVIDRRLPVPAFIADLKSLSAKELEVRAIHASRFHRNWCSPHPRPRRNVDFPIRELITEDDSSLQLSKDHPHPISQVLFPPGYNGELLITVERNRVTCWEIPFEGTEAFLVAERHLPDCVIDGLVINDDPDSEGLLIVMFSRIINT